MPILKNARAITRSVQNLVQTIPTERFFQPILGSDVRASLFDFVDFATAGVIEEQIITTIDNFEMSAVLLYNLLISLLSTETLHLAVLDYTEAMIRSWNLHPGHLHPVPCLGVQLVDLIMNLVDITISSCNYNKVRIMSS